MANAGYIINLGWYTLELQLKLGTRQLCLNHFTTVQLAQGGICHAIPDLHTMCSGDHDIVHPSIKTYINILMFIGTWVMYLAPTMSPTKCKQCHCYHKLWLAPCDKWFMPRKFLCEARNELHFRSLTWTWHFDKRHWSIRLYVKIFTNIECINSVHKLSDKVKRCILFQDISSCKDTTSLRFTLTV